MIYDDVIQLVGRTPIVRLDVLCERDDAILLAKMEMANPGGSVKDRAALGMIREAEARGILARGSTLVEPTSGNTGISLAMIAARRGYRMILTMPESMSLERRALLRHFGAELILTPAATGMRGAIERAEAMVKEKGYVMPSQFTNPANPDYHRRTTAQEILADLNRPLDAFVCGVGTGGTITGVGSVLKQHFPEVQVIAVEPEDSPVLSGGSPGPHGIQGMGAGFKPDILDESVIDRVLTVSFDDAVGASRALAREEGILAGISAGAAVSATLSLIQEVMEAGARDYTASPFQVLTVLPDTGERYMSVIGESGEFTS